MAAHALRRSTRLVAPDPRHSAFAVSYDYNLDTVPTIILAVRDGRELRRCVGFGKLDWQALYVDMHRLTGAPPPSIDWGRHPESLPAAGRNRFETRIAERLAAEAYGSPLPPPAHLGRASR